MVRQETAFVIDARSEAGALGLMQLMPSTGRLTGRKLNMPIRNNRALLNIENNLRLGVSYLKEVLAATTATRCWPRPRTTPVRTDVNSWLPDKTLDADIWVETIPFGETRDYVKNVMSYTTVYDHRLGSRPARLQEHMQSVYPAEK